MAHARALNSSFCSVWQCCEPKPEKLCTLGGYPLHLGFTLFIFLFLFFCFELNPVMGFKGYIDPNNQPLLCGACTALLHIVLRTLGPHPSMVCTRRPGEFPVSLFCSCRVIQHCYLRVESVNAKMLLAESSGQNKEKLAWEKMNMASSSKDW